MWRGVKKKGKKKTHSKANNYLCIKVKEKKLFDVQSIIMHELKE